MKKVVLALAIGISLSSISYSQDFRMPAPSPTTSIVQDFSTSSIEINYSRPATKGRKIFGDLIPYGKEWRTGANSATTITFNEEVNFGGTMVKPGTYSIYTIPNKSSWQIILNSSTQNWGLSGYDKAKNVADISVKSQKLKNKVESFTIAVENITNTTCEVTLAWEKTKVAIPILVENSARIEAYLTKELKGEKPPYVVAAKYYLEKGKNLEEALNYAEKGINANPKAFYIHWIKAEILNKMGRKSEAIAAAKLAADGAKGSPYEAEYLNNYNKISK